MASFDSEIEDGEIVSDDCLKLVDSSSPVRESSRGNCHVPGSSPFFQSKNVSETVPGEQISENLCLEVKSHHTVGIPTEAVLNAGHMSTKNDQSKLSHSVCEIVSESALASASSSLVHTEERPHIDESVAPKSNGLVQSKTKSVGNVDFQNYPRVCKAGSVGDPSLRQGNLNAPTLNSSDLGQPGNTNCPSTVSREQLMPSPMATNDFDSCGEDVRKDECINKVDDQYAKLTQDTRTDNCIGKDMDSSTVDCGAENIPALAADKSATNSASPQISMGKGEDSAMQDASPTNPSEEKLQLSTNIEAESGQLGDSAKSNNSVSCKEEPGENQGLETENLLSSAQEGQAARNAVISIVDGIVDAALDDGSKSPSEPASTSDNAHDVPFYVDKKKETPKSQRDSPSEDSSSDSDGDSETSESESESSSISSEDSAGSNIPLQGSNHLPTVPAEGADNENLIEESQGGGPILSKNEMDEDKVEIPRLEVSISENDAIMQLGEILSIMEKGVIVRSTQSSRSSRPQSSTVEDIENASALNIGSVLCFSDRKPLGRVYDTFGPVHEPYYIVRFNSNEEVQNLAHTSPGTPIFFVRKHSHIVFGSQMKSKGYDTSNIHDEEVGAVDEEFSDDEKERAAKNSRKRKKGSNDGESGRGKPSMVTQKRPRSRQNSGRNPKRENFAQYRQEGHYGHNSQNQYASTPFPPPVMQIGMQPMVMGAPGFPSMFPPQGQLAPMMQPTQMIPGSLNPQFPAPHTVNMINSSIPMHQAQQPESHGFHAHYGTSPSPGGPWNGEPWADSIMHNGIQQGQINPAALPRTLPPEPPPQPPSQSWNRMS